MSDPRRHAAALAVVLTLLSPAVAAAQAPLLAQIEDATPTPQPQPPLSEDPPDDLDGGEEEPEPADEGEGQREATGAGLPDTGADAAVTALLGLGLLASGGGLRLTLAGSRGRPR